MRNDHTLRAVARLMVDSVRRRRMGRDLDHGHASSLGVPDR
jgi:hypothetical protein